REPERDGNPSRDRDRDRNRGPRGSAKPPERERRGLRVPQRPSMPPRRIRATDGSRFGRPLRTFMVWALIFLTMLLGIQYLGTQQKRPDVSYTWFRNEVDRGNIESIEILDKEVHGELKEPVRPGTRPGETPTRSFKVVLPSEDPKLPDLIWEKNPGIEIN